jgi:hypothetical protein
MREVADRILAEGSEGQEAGGAQQGASS